MPAEYESRKLAEIALDYEVSGVGMRKIAERHGVSPATVSRAVMLERQASGTFETRRVFDLKQHVIDVLVESAELQQEILAIVRGRVGDKDFVERQSGRDWASLMSVLAKENRSWYDYFRRTFGDSGSAPASALPDEGFDTDSFEQYES